MEKIGVTGKFFSTLISIYSNDLAAVKGERELSETFTSSLGVKQGCVLSTTLFNLYLNDLSDRLTKFPLTQNEHIEFNGVLVSHLLFADDLVLLERSEKVLQQYLDYMNIFTNENRMRLNLDKTKVIVFNNTGRAMNNYTFKYQDKIIENVTSYKYLGIFFSAIGNFSVGKNELRKVALKALFKLKKSMGDNFKTDLTLTLRLFDALIKPILLYGCEVWGVDVSKKERDPIEAVHVKFCKLVLGVGKNASNNACRAELGRYPLYIDAKCRAFNFLTKLNEPRSGFLSHDLFLDCLENENKTDWLRKIKDTICKVGLGEAWMNMVETQVPANSGYGRIMKQRLKDIELQTWLSEVSDDEKKNGQKINCGHTVSLNVIIYLKHIFSVFHRTLNIERNMLSRA